MHLVPLDQYFIPQLAGNVTRPILDARVAKVKLARAK
jgi:hypothetical protein